MGAKEDMQKVADAMSKKAMKGKGSAKQPPPKNIENLLNKLKEQDELLDKKLKSLGGSLKNPEGAKNYQGEFTK